MPLLRRHPLAASLAAAAAVLVLAAALVLPRLDGLEIAAATATATATSAAGSAGAARMTIEVEVHYRLASAPGGVVVVRSPAPEGAGRDDAHERIEVTSGTAVARVVLVVPRREAAPVVATLEPGGGSGGSILDSLQAGRRRDFRVVTLR